MKDDPENSPNSPPEKEIIPPPRPPGPLERHLNLGPLDKPVDLAACREFLSLNGGSILYCLSAMCVIYGIAAILGPVFARSFVLGETVPCIVVLNVYEIALLAVLLVIVVWQEVTDDAISLVVLSGVFLVVSGIALTTTSNSQPRWVLLIGACCFALAMGKVFVLRRFIGMSISPVLWAGLAVVLGWNFLAGARLADATTTKTVGREQWLVSWLVLLAGGVILLLDAALRRPKSADRSSVRVPFLRRPAMGWILALVLLAAAGVHQRAFAYVFDVRSTFIDYLPLVSILSLFSLQLALRLRSEPAYFEAGLAAVPLAAFLCALIEGPVLEKPALGIQLLWYPPVFLGLTGIAVLLTGIHKRCRTLLPVVPFYALGVVLTMTSATVTPADLHWGLSGALLVSGLLLVGLLRRSVALCILAVVLGTVGFGATEAFEGFARFLGLSDWGAALGLAGLGTLVVALLFGRMRSAILALAALGIMICVFDFLPSELGRKDLFAVLAVLLLGVGLWMRLRHWPSIAILCFPIAYRLVVASVLLASWRYVLLGFVLLFAGALLSIRKGKRTRREAAAAGPRNPTRLPQPPPSPARRILRRPHPLGRNGSRKARSPRLLSGARYHTPERHVFFPDSDRQDASGSYNTAQRGHTGSVERKGGEMGCPKCGADVEKVTYQEIKVDRCTRCKGIWFDMLEAEQLKTLKGSEDIDTGDPKLGKVFSKVEKINCPVCHTQMIRMVDLDQPHIWYEGCTVCYGLFFDAGEFRDYKEETVLDFFKDLFTKERR